MKQLAAPLRALSFALILALALLPSRTFNASARQGATRDLAVSRVTIRDEKGAPIKLYEKSYALVIGASRYPAGWPELKGVEKDVEAVAVALERQGFQVTVVKNPDAAPLKKSFEEFIDKYGQQVENRLLFYFAGHGHTMKQSYGADMGYLVPVDAPRPDADAAGFRAKALNLKQIERYAEDIQAKHALFLFDSCFSGSVLGLSRTRAVPDPIGYKTSQPVRQFIASGSADEQVPDESIFRRQFVEAVKGDADANRDGYVTGTELGEFLQDRVITYSKNTQHPQYGKIRNEFLDKGDFVFALAKAEPTQGAAAGAGEIAFWESVRGSDNPDDLRAYMEKYPAGQFAPLVQRRLATLVEAGDKFFAHYRFSEAYAQYKQAVVIRPDDARLHRQIGQALIHLRNPSAARKSFEEAIRLDPNEPEVYIALADALQAEAWALVEDASAEAPDVTAQVKAYYAKAEQVARELVRREPDEARGHETLAMVLGRQAAPEARKEAEAEYKTALRINPKSIAARRFMLGELVMSERFTDAEKQYRELIILEPTNGMWRVQLGALLDYEDKLSEAEQQYISAVRLDPENPVFRERLSEFLQKHNRMDEAEAALREAARLDPNNEGYKQQLQYLHDWRVTAGAPSTGGGTGNPPAAGFTPVSGALAGKIVDQGGAPLPDVAVTLTSSLTGVRYVKKSEKDGTFTFSQLAPGYYVLKIEKGGYRSEERRQTVYVNRLNHVMPNPLLLLPDNK